MNKVGTEPTPLRVIKFQNYLKQCAIYIPTNGEALGFLGRALADADYKSTTSNQTWVAPTDHDTALVLPTASAKGASTRSASEKYIEHMNRLIQHQPDVRQHEKEKTKYDKYQAGITALRNLITTNIEESFVSAHNNSITGFRLVGPIVLMDYIQTNYWTVLPKQLRENEVALDSQWEPTTPTAVLFTCTKY